MQTHIFNRKYIRNQLQSFKKEDIKQFEARHKIISNWNYSLEQSNLDKTKEEAIQGDFLSQIFTNILGYKNRIGESLWNIQQEQKTKFDGTKADGSLGFFSGTVNDTRVVIELKDAKTELDRKQNRSNNQSPVEQAFSYQYKYKNCKWVIVSNFREIRLYSANTMVEFEQFFVKDLKEDEAEFKKFIYLLQKDHLIDRDHKSKVDQLLENNEKEEAEITNKFYNKYKKIRTETYRHLQENNPTVDELIVFEKIQKLLDRFIFVCFCEDTDLLPKNTFRQVVDVAKNSFNMSDTKIWGQLKGLFHSIDKGNPPLNINRFNGGLFAQDDELDNLVIRDEIFTLFEEITEYDFNSELSVNILGHVFEQSISDIEEFKAKIVDEEFDKKKGKRKKDGVFYTPNYVTRYIVKETVGRWFSDKRDELGEGKLPDISSAKNNSAKTRYINQHIKFWEEYREAVANIRILDPACGSGAFLNAAFDYLMEEGAMINEMVAELKGGQTTLFDLDKHILRYNLFGVDLNPESIEISKLSLWIKTANKSDQLTSLDENIKCGNSLAEKNDIDPEKYFKWEQEFPDVIKEGGFDVIIGNPPYGASVDDETKEYLKNRFIAYNHNFDVYTAFMELSISLLKEKCYLGFINPVSWQTGPNYKPTREFIAENTALIQGIKLPYDIFDAYVDTGIYVIQKGVSHFYYTDVFEFPIRSNREKAFENQLDFKTLSNKAWIDTKDKKIILNPGFYTLNEKVRKGTEKLDNFMDSVRGILAKKEDIYDEVKTKRDRMFFSGDLYRYEFRREFNYVKYGDNLKEFPRDDKYFKGPRILVRRLISRQFRVMASYTEEEFVNKKDIYNLIITSDKVKPLYILGILNSKLVSYLVTKGSTTATKDDFSQLTLTDLKNIPINVVSEERQEEISEKVDDILKVQEKFVSLRKNVLEFIKETLGIKKVTNKMFTFYNLDFSEFEKELKKQKVKLNIHEKEEWFTWFKEKKETMQQEITKMHKLDQIIDQAIYNVYELNEEEINLIEQNI